MDVVLGRVNNPIQQPMPVVEHGLMGDIVPTEISGHMNTSRDKDTSCAHSDFDLTHTIIHRTRTNDTYFYNCSTNQSSASLPELYQRPHTHSRSDPDHVSEKRKVNLRLPAFEDLEFNVSSAHLHSEEGPKESNLLQQDYRTSTPIPKIFNGLTPLLTPPPDDAEPLKESCLLPCASSQVKATSAGEAAQQVSTQTSPTNASSGTAHGLSLPTSIITSDQSRTSGSPWVTRASQTIVSSLNAVQPLHQIQLVSQTMPSQAKDGRSRPTFEDVLETIQDGMQSSPFITITHAVPQVRVMEELPKTPPSTPNARHEINDYFGSDQTIFTHAAVVPIYHNHGRIDNMSATRLPHHIAAPYTVQVSILERFVPPTMPSEVTDFFGLSSRSYLADRLSELSANNGSLLLVYPTRSGGRSFTRDYIGPVIDPLLRQFILLNNLTSDAAAMMGTMTAVDHMLNFTQMKQRVGALCQNLSQRPAIRGQKSVYQITQCETADVVLDRSTWINWFVEQEQPRLRQNLVEYHQSGGRMPGASGHKETTTGMLTREIVDGIHKSREPAGDADIEVGVFVITRSMVA